MKKIANEKVNASMENDCAARRLLSINKPDSSYGTILKSDSLIIDFSYLHYDILVRCLQSTSF